MEGECSGHGRRNKALYKGEEGWGVQGHLRVFFAPVPLVFRATDEPIFFLRFCADRPLVPMCNSSGVGAGGVKPG